MDEYLAIGLCLLLLLCLLFIFFYSISHNKSDKTVSTKVKITEAKPSLIPPTSPVKKVVKKNLDAIYAESHGMRVCKYCQTLNASGAPECAACGKKMA